MAVSETLKKVANLINTIQTARKDIKSIETKNLGDPENPPTPEQRARAVSGVRSTRAQQIGEAVLDIINPPRHHLPH